jgi:hypothetical protein
MYKLNEAAVVKCFFKKLNAVEADKKLTCALPSREDQVDFTLFTSVAAIWPPSSQIISSQLMELRSD